MRFCCLINVKLAGLIFGLVQLGALVSSLVCFFQCDAKAFIAFSRVVHMRRLFVVFLVLLGHVDFISSVVSLSHGFVSGLMFFLVGVFYDFSGSRSSVVCRGVVRVGRSLLGFWLISNFLNAGFPPFIGTWGEFFSRYGFFLLSPFRLLVYLLIVFMGGIFCYFLFSLCYGNFRVRRFCTSKVTLVEICVGLTLTMFCLVRLPLI
jgi:NADH-quinone oxidoreductase subunit M